MEGNPHIPFPIYRIMSTHTARCSRRQDRSHWDLTNLKISAYDVPVLYIQYIHNLPIIPVLSFSWRFFIRRAGDLRSVSCVPRSVFAGHPTHVLREAGLTTHHKPFFQKGHRKALSSSQPYARLAHNSKHAPDWWFVSNETSTSLRGSHCPASPQQPASRWRLAKCWVPSPSYTARWRARLVKSSKGAWKSRPEDAAKNHRAIPILGR